MLPGKMGIENKTSYVSVDAKFIHLPLGQISWKSDEISLKSWLFLK